MEYFKINSSRIELASGVISGFETVLDVGQPIIKNLTQEAKEHVNNPSLMVNRIPV
jgi:hypothetical protein